MYPEVLLSRRRQEIQHSERRWSAMSQLEVATLALISHQKRPKITDSVKTYGCEELLTHVAIIRNNGTTTRSVEGKVISVRPTQKTRKSVKEEADELLRKIAKQKGFKLP
jgi:hypothetical protein